MKQHIFAIESENRKRIIGGIPSLLLIYFFYYIFAHRNSIAEFALMLLIWLILAVIFVFAVNRAGTAQIKIILDETGLHQTWQTQYFLAKNQNLDILWKDITGYKFLVENTQEYICVINRKNKWKIKFHRKIDSQDDYHDFEYNFKSMYEKYAAGQNRESSRER